MTGLVVRPGIFRCRPDATTREFAWVMDHAVLPLIEARRPQAIMLQAGADGLEEDPLAKLSLSNNSHRDVVRAMMQRTARLVVLGGGGYNPWTVGRCWALIWGTLNDFPIPDRLPAEAPKPALRALRFDRAAGRNPPEHWFSTLLDQPTRRAGARRHPATDQGEADRMKRRYLRHWLSTIPLTAWAQVPKAAGSQTPEATGPQAELPKEKLVIVGQMAARSTSSTWRWR